MHERNKFRVPCPVVGVLVGGESEGVVHEVRVGQVVRVVTRLKGPGVRIVVVVILVVPVERILWNGDGGNGRIWILAENPRTETRNCQS